MEKIIEVKNLIKRYKKAKVNAVDDVSFYVEKGAFFSLLGPNGAGKTTILSILNTTLSPTEGEVIIAGSDLQRESEKVRKNIGVIFQNPSLDLNLTAEENIRFHANLYGLYSYSPFFKFMPGEYKDRVEELAKILGLDFKEIFKPVKEFSGGMKRKLEIIRGLMHKPKVLFLDEPTTGLDPLSRKNLWQYLQKIRKEEDITIFLTTHYLEEAEGADYLCIINKGKLVYRGTPTEIKEALIDEFLVVDSAQNQKLAAELKSKNIKFTGSGPFKIEITSENAQGIIKSIDTQLTKLDIHSPSLEEAYIEIIEKENHEKRD
jgi:ABC-2 type transport system ATP-binding protein